MSWLSSIAERFPNLARHARVLRTSWAMENEAAATRKARSDHEFLPAALEIMEKPPSPGLRWLLITLCALFSIALLWSFIGKVDVVAVASGKTLPVANVKIIQPIEIGSVRAIRVKNGQHVKKGELLIELDPTLAGADQAQASQGLLSSRIAEARGNALMAYLRGQPARFMPPPGATSEIAAIQSQMIASLIAEYEAQQSSLLQARAEKAAELAGSAAEIQKLQQSLPLIDQGYAARKELTDKGYFSKIRLLDYEQQRVELINNIDVQRSNAAKARAAMLNIDAQLATLRATFGKTAITDLAEAEDNSALRTQELQKTARRRAFQEIRSPVDGIVQQLALATIGGIVQPAQALMVIVPDGADIQVEVMIQNKDIGFVREGQGVRIKLEAFPFTDYGLIPGILETISSDAIDTGTERSQQRDEKSRPVEQGLVYSARIRMQRSTIRVAGKDQIIGPGLAVQAEIKTGERRIIDYLLSPIAKTMDEAGRER
jgi:hemolysin D